MNTTEDYIHIMIDSLKKKTVILDRILAKNQLQTQCLENKDFQDVDWDIFNAAMVEKEAEIEHINEMDDGFQALYDRVSNQLADNKLQYADEIRFMQSLIRHLEEQSVQIRTGEERNRAMIEKIMGGRKKEIKHARTSLKVAANYYQSMSKAMSVNLASVDKKK